MVDDSPANPAPVPSKARSVLRLWALALAASAALAASGERWPEPLAVQPALVWCLVLVPPALVALWLLSQWRNGGEGESLH
jgi:hypothetical protein